MNKKAILLKAALGVYRVKCAESNLPDPLRERLEKTVNKSKLLAALKGSLSGLLIGAGAGGAGAGMLMIGNGAALDPDTIAERVHRVIPEGAMWGAPFGGIAGGIHGYLKAKREAEQAQEMLDTDAWAVRQRNKQKGID